MLKKGESILISFENRTYYCPVELAMDIIGGKWRAVILWYLSKGTLRFHEIKKEISTISERVLSKEPRALEKYNLIERKIYPEVPPKVEYTLTDLGRSLTPLLDQVSNFGESFSKRFGALKKTGK